jgi:hypothetical protein
VFPIEFHMTVSGEERIEGRSAGGSGTTAVTLTVQGAYSDPRFKEKVETAGDGLRTLVEETFQALQRQPSDPAVAEEPPAWPRSGPVPRQEPVAPPGPAPLRPGSGEEDGSVKLSRLRDLLLEGEITSEEYRRLRHEIERDQEGREETQNRPFGRTG